MGLPTLSDLALKDSREIRVQKKWSNDGVGTTVGPPDVPIRQKCRTSKTASRVSIYIFLLAMWALTYFGRPFE